MPPARDKREQRLRALIDPKMYDQDAFYHATVSIFRAFLTAMEHAMEDEDVERPTIERVLNRVVYACPTGADAYERVEQNARELKRLMETKPTMKICAIPDCGCTGYAHS